MAISAIGSQSVNDIQTYLVRQIQAVRPTAYNAQDDATEIDSAPQKAEDPQSLQFLESDVRQSINAQIAADVEKGVITQDQADTVLQAFNDFERTLNAAPVPTNNERAQTPSTKTPSPSQAQNAPTAAQNGNAPAGGGNNGAESTGSSTEIVNVETTIKDTGWVTKTTTYADNSEVSTTVYDASKDTTKTQQPDDSTLAVLQSLVGQNNAAYQTTNYVNDLLSQRRLNIIA
ncbi:MAG: hypothetical protein HWE34_15795 [Methylocystaceae bacterium]|nr:hypothetical protein [Methylocystaceae bacterium]